MTLVSVIIPTFNRAFFVKRAINSVLNQCNHNFEIIVVDDGSTDDTEFLLSPLFKEGKIKYFKQRNLGVSAARNFGASKASGELLSFLDSDDEWLPTKLQEQIDFLQKNPFLHIVYGQEIWIRNGKRVNQRVTHQKYEGWIFDKCIQQCFIAPSSVMLKTKLFYEMGGFDEEFVVCEDYDLWLKISSLYEIGYIHNPIIIKYGGHDDQLSTKYIAMDIWRLRSLIRILKIRNLSNLLRENIKEVITIKGAILRQGYQKYGNMKGIEEVDSFLEQVKNN
jgi:GT2 family glycosyltransferase